jgi:hypothetical protein
MGRDSWEWGVSYFILIFPPHKFLENIVLCDFLVSQQKRNVAILKHIAVVVVVVVVFVADVAAEVVADVFVV